MTERRPPWYTLLNKYHWFVLAVAALGWLFDTMDQQLFLMARIPAMRELLAPSPGAIADQGDVDKYSGIATAIFLMGWAAGGLFFGVLGDRIGRAKTMLLTILLYSLCTGLSAFSIGFWDFAAYRFVTGLGVGGEFAVGVALVAEVMPAAARPFALGLLQALSAVGNISAALINNAMGEIAEQGLFDEIELFGIQLTAWRAMFLVGTLPALLAVVVRGRLKEPDTWQTAKAEAGVEGEKRKFGSYSELLGTPIWRKRALVGLAIAIAGVIGLWGIAFFSFDLARSVFRKGYEAEYRASGLADADRDLLRLTLREGAIPQGSEGANPADLKPVDFLDSAPGAADAQSLWSGVLSLHNAGKPIEREALLKAAATASKREARNPDVASAARAAREKYLAGDPESADVASLTETIKRRSAELGGNLTEWVGYSSMLFNAGAFFGIYAFTLFTDRVGRRAAFAVAFLAAAGATVFTFLMIDRRVDALWMMPILGFCTLAPFGGYAIYFPELFPTHLRSTGTSFCYNVGRFLSASGPLTLGYLTGEVFVDTQEPLRWAGIAMCATFAVGLLALPFAPETKGQPLPDGSLLH
ncbi:MAG TPA: MFS transporter [Pirellulaceae bacterium]|jgi:MFS family permease|nr:MFS transporter [Pirellulaceae bacterium]